MARTRKHKKIKTRIDTDHSGKKHEWSLTNKFIAALGLLATFITLMMAIPYVRPNVWLSPSITNNPNDPFATRFEVSNTGIFAVNDVRIEASFSGYLGSIALTLKDDMTKGSPEVITNLEPGQRPVQWIPNSIKVPPHIDDKLDMLFTITFRPLLFPWEKTVKQRFVTIRDQVGQLQWVEYPIDAP